MATASAATATSTTQDMQTTRPDTKSPILSQRSLKQLSLFFAGAGFLALSTLVTRRSIARKRIVTIPKFYQPSNLPSAKMESDRSLIAVEALSLATLNVCGFGIMATGGLSWAFDISTVAELRYLARRNIKNGGQLDEEAEREVEEWVAKVLGGRQELQKPDEETKSQNIGK
ncbi:hypothetical protein BX600DRAFT_437340 [Xylariales sp. PMI_506]|nr:hypothetical protein BX600DRAFT_437340 [Xylariales sp. PMI_506]